MENVGLALPHIYYNMETDLDETIRRFQGSSEENGTGQYLEPQGKGTLGPVFFWNFQF